MPRFNKFELRQLSEANGKTQNAVRTLNKAMSQREAIESRKGLVAIKKDETLTELSARRASWIKKQSGSFDTYMLIALAVILIIGSLYVSHVEDKRAELQIQNKLLQELVIEQSTACNKGN